ncbi:CyP450 monooxygenase [Lentinus tigrinus ALCF2SS1-7]|uniref:CyP450 monooxygenase n=1 Tax=Lentinus tigrinus ALCF2SS1-6 TaxID=1328759 RepID=A0A5C2SKY2_9APHY|nr:CyP450 monooxygenase [Lentinus tigrinus ALCF2SS1-6]RPD76717.1 CyP450 monooxygenase [Lentinus tigrinus ALCF2SS1-7]
MTILTSPWTALAVTAVLAWIVKTYVSQVRRKARLPPGPTPRPIIGNVLDMPQTHFGREFAEMSKKHGDVIHLDLLGQSMIVLGSLQSASDLMEKRSNNYSSRPSSVMVDLCGFGWLTVLKNYGTDWRHHRRTFHKYFNPEALPHYQPIQLKVIRELLRNILGRPADLSVPLKLSFGATVMRIAYGLNIDDADNEYYKMVERIGEIGGEIAKPGRFPVEAMPVLRFLPSWFPGAGFKRFAAEAKREMTFTINRLFDAAKAAMDRGEAKDSMVVHFFDDGDAHDELHYAEAMMKELTLTTYAAGADTTNASVAAFFLAMALHPEVQMKAQQELDGVVGTNRLPEFSDRPSLPYIDALVKELLRWHVVLPLGVPHRVIDDDEYRGYLIPGGATIAVNVWSISRDPAVYPDPERFDPERFLKNGRLHLEGRDPANFAFGFGRRVCPGRLFGEASLFILCASVLSAFSIGAPLDKDGSPVVLTYSDIANEMVTRPEVHNYTIQPRSPQAERLVLESC